MLNYIMDHSKSEGFFKFNVAPRQNRNIAQADRQILSLFRWKMGREISILTQAFNTVCSCERIFGVALFILSAADVCSIQPPRKWQLISIAIMRQGKGCRCQQSFSFFRPHTWNSNFDSVETP